MPTRKGRYFAISYFRRLVVDLMHFSAQVPSATIERQMDLATLYSARESSDPQPGWSAIFAKAYAIVSVKTPALRTSYLRCPWARFYEHASSIATINIDREVEGERIVLYCHIASPESQSLVDLDAVVDSHAEAPVESLLSYRRAVRMSRIPWPIRRWIWWLGLNVSGPLRCHNFGTFGLTSVGALGAGIVFPHPLLTTQLHFGTFEDDRTISMRISFDHRVLDGATIAQALSDLEKVLTKDIVAELQRGESKVSGSSR